MIFRASLLLLSLLLGGCSYFGIETEADMAAKKEANNKAIGAGCRYSNRSIEQCYERNPKASKAGAFQGWKDMDVYMRENKMAGVPADNTSSTEKTSP